MAFRRSSCKTELAECDNKRNSRSLTLNGERERERELQVVCDSGDAESRMGRTGRWNETGKSAGSVHIDSFKS